MKKADGARELLLVEAMRRHPVQFAPTVARLDLRRLKRHVKLLTQRSGRPSA